MGYIRGFDWEGEDKAAAMVYLTPKLRIRLTDPDRRPLSGGKCRVAGNPDEVFDCDANGIAEIPLYDRSRKTIGLEWEEADSASLPPAERFPWCGIFDVEIRSAQDEDCAKRLAHLGFDGATLAEQVREYQKHFGLQVSGKIADIRDALMHWHDGGERPA
jgi:hypothetical protein